MSLLPTSTIITNEVKLFDFKGTKASVTFGDADINDGYSYLRINFRANDNKFDFWQDKPVINFIADEEITFNDKKIWHENNDGPMSGLNADLLDGLHASEFKDRMGHNHFGHAFLPGGSKMFVKIATFTPRRVGKAPDFNNEGTAPFQGIFASNIVKSMEATAKFDAFVEDTPESLGPIGFNGFEHTDMSSEGVYNSTLRASISLLKNGSTKEPPWQGPETVDIHIGIFEDPTNENTDGWSCTSRYFYMSCHGRNLPFIKEKDDPEHDYLVGGNVNPEPGNSPTRSYSSPLQLLASVSQPDHTDTTHTPPPVDYSDYAPVPDPSKDDYVREVFPPVIAPGFGYQKDIDSFRLIHTGSKVDEIDGVQVVTHTFELYMVVDTKMEVHVQPYMSSSCLFYNYQKPISSSELPEGPFMNPSSVYDTRYSHVEHRHRNYELKMEEMDAEIDEIWDTFDDYVTIDQGLGNKNKVLMTNANGMVVAVKDNLERHQDSRRLGKRVLITTIEGCIAEADITTQDLAQLEGIRANIQDQLDEMGGKIPPKVDTAAYVRKVGDTMTGHLNMKNGAEVKVYGAGDYHGSFYAKDQYLGVYDNTENRAVWNYIMDNDFGQKIFKLNKCVMAFDGHTLQVAEQFTGITPKIGDLWIKNL